MMRLDALSQSISATHGAEALLPLVQDAGIAVQDCSAEIRTLSYLLHPPMLDAIGLASAIEWFCEGFSQRSGIKLDLELAPELRRLPQDLEMAVYRIVQESLGNIHRHSGSKSARIRLSSDDGKLLLEVSDRGKGMGPEFSTVAAGKRAGVGISGMRERVRLLDGQFAIDSDSNGTTIRASFPLPADS